MYVDDFAKNLVLVYCAKASLCSAPNFVTTPMLQMVEEELIVVKSDAVKQASKLGKAEANFKRATHDLVARTNELDVHAAERKRAEADVETYKMSLEDAVKKAATIHKSMQVHCDCDLSVHTNLATSSGNPDRAKC